MTFTSNYIRTEGNGRLRCYRTPAVASRQLESSLGAVVILLLVGFVAAVSHYTPSKASPRIADMQAPRPAIVHASVRVISMTAPQAAALVPDDNGSSL